MLEKTMEQRIAEAQAAHKATQDKHVEAILAKCPEWEALGIASVVCCYGGSGDEGFIDSIYAEPSTVDVDLDEDLFDPLTFAEVTGDCEGGGGEITVDVKARTITRKEWSYYTETSYLPEQTLTHQEQPVGTPDKTRSE